MKILMVNKFLYAKGGAEVYMLRLGEYLSQQGHQVQYFGMDQKERSVGNRVNAYTSNIDFHGGSMLRKLTYPAKIIYSAEARRKIRIVLDDFQPDVCHLNNFNYQLTPSILLEIRKWEKETGHKCKIIYTAHDPQLVCPNHMCMNPNTRELCFKCLSGHYMSCTKGKCIHGSYARSVLGSMEAMLWKHLGAYKEIDTIICCTHYMKKLLDSNPVLAERTVAMHNFIEPIACVAVEKKDYVLYFGRYSQEKGIATLVQAARELPHIPFVFAGSGPLEELLTGVPNIRNVGFQSGEALNKLVREASFSVLPSEWNENCPFSILESQMQGTPVLGANIAGIPELVEDGVTGKLFESRNLSDLKAKIEALWADKQTLHTYAENCKKLNYDTVEQYAEKIMQFYR